MTVVLIQENASSFRGVVKNGYFMVRRAIRGGGARSIILTATAATHFCREFSFVAITCFLRGTFGQNFVRGGPLKHFNGPGGRGRPFPF